MHKFSIPPTIFYKNNQYDSIALAGGHMEAVVQKTIDAIDALPVPKSNGVDVFKAAVMKYFKFFKSIYTVYREYGEAGTDEKRTEIMEELQKMVDQKQNVVDELQSAQRKARPGFARFDDAFCGRLGSISANEIR